MLAINSVLHAQKDSTTVVPRKKSNIMQAAINAVSRSHSSDTGQVILNTKSETPFLAYEGKGIRHIIIRQFGFEKTFTDTSRGIKYFGTRLLNSLHKNTRQWVIRNNLFLKEGSTLNALKVADNERFLRTLNFIQDARILVNYLPDNPDSVDLVVITKDLFTITAEINDFSPDRQKFRVGDANVMGIGQRLQFTSLMDKRRNPSYGFDVLYTKTNICNTFINASLDYSRINHNRRDGTENESAWYFTLERPLVSQYKHMAGALTIGNSQSYNTYGQPDSTFYHYRYSNYDIWVGYNLDVKKILANKKRSLRKFVSLRYLQNNFSEIPYQVQGKYDQRFNDRKGVLGQITFFKQDFYKTNYIYGFGTTEDMPYGYNVALTAGWYKQFNLSRPYAGIDANRYIASNKGDFIQYFIRAGGYLHQNSLQDASVLLGTSLFSRLFLYKNLKLRQYIRFSYTRQFDRVALDPLRINNPFGLRYFISDSLQGDRRMSLHSETFFFLKYKAFGFQFAPFVFGDATLLTPEKTSISKSNMYYGLGGGVRTRNENLVFGTIELRAIYFPRKVENLNTFKVQINTNLRFRYNTNFVKAPDVIQLNTDDGNNIF